MKFAEQKYRILLFLLAIDPSVLALGNNSQKKRGEAIFRTHLVFNQP
jgi:hypothetical protein